MKRVPVAAALILATTVAARAQSGDPDMIKVVDGFYRAYESFRPPDGVPEASIRSRFEPFISPALDKLLTDVADAQGRYEKLTQGRFPPLIDGDPFTPNFDGATSYSIGACVPDPHGAHCQVALSFEGGKDKQRSWTDTVALVRTDDGWRVNDIAYGGNWDGGNRGTLAETLTSAVEHGNNMKQ
jgi:hypothetical protein